MGYEVWRVEDVDYLGLGFDFDLGSWELPAKYGCMRT
jgi:hypothetical protein